jgi:type IV fimbrial biogenesis protein FimT
MYSRVARTRRLSHSQNGSYGLSTLELVVSLGIALAISAIAIPSITKTVRVYQLNDAASQVAGIVKLTRFEAIRRNTSVSCLNSQAAANGPASLWSDTNGDNVEQGTEKQILLGTNATLVAEAAVPSAAALAPAVGVSAITALNPASDNVRFDQRGAVTPAGVYVIYIGNSSSADGGFRAVVVLPSGSVQVWTYTGIASGVWQQLS